MSSEKLVANVPQYRETSTIFADLPGCPVVGSSPGGLYEAMQWLIRRGWVFRLRRDGGLNIVVATGPPVPNRDRKSLQWTWDDGENGMLRGLLDVYCLLSREQRIECHAITNLPKSKAV